MKKVNSSDDLSKGVTRALHPVEIGKLIKHQRKIYGWKQCVLAKESNINERTLQRIENGHKISDDNLKRIAMALNLELEIFTSTRYIPTEEEAIKNAEEFIKKHHIIDLKILSDERDFEEILHCPIHIVNDECIATEEVKSLIACFKDNLRDWTDIYSTLEHSQKLEGRIALFEEARKIKSKGFIIRLGTCICEAQRSKFRMKIGVIYFEKLSNKVAKFLPGFVPKEFFASY